MEKGKIIRNCAAVGLSLLLLSAGPAEDNPKAFTASVSDFVAAFTSVAQEKPIDTTVPDDAYELYIKGGVPDDLVSEFYYYDISIYEINDLMSLDEDMEYGFILNAASIGVKMDDYSNLIPIIGARNLDNVFTPNMTDPHDSRGYVFGVEQYRKVTDYMPIETVVEYLYRGIDTEILTAYFNGITPETSSIFIEGGVHEVDNMIVLAAIFPDIDEAISAFNTYNEIVKNESISVKFINYRIPLEYISAWADEGIINTAIADFYYLDISGPDDPRVRQYLDYKIPANSRLATGIRDMAAEFYQGDTNKFNKISIGLFLLPDYIASGVPIEIMDEYIKKDVSLSDIPYLYFFGIMPEELADGEKYASDDFIMSWDIDNGTDVLISKFGIKEFHRYPIVFLRDTLNFSDPDYITPGPVALVVFARYDHNGAFDSNEKLRSLSYGYEIILFETSTNNIEDYVNFYPVELVVINAHGSTLSERFSSQSDETSVFEVGEHEAIDDIRYYPRLWFLNSCLVGRGGVYMNNGEKSRNLANWLATSTKRPVIAANTYVYDIFLIYENDLSLDRVLFSSYISPHEIYVP